MREKFSEIWSAIRQLSEPTGTAINGLVQQVQSALANINSTVTNAINTLSYTKEAIDNKVANHGHAQTAIAGTWDKAVATTGAGRFDGGLTSADVYTRLVTGGGQYRSAYVHESGVFGYAPSSRQFKTGIEDIPRDKATMSALKQLRPRVFQYWASPPYSQEMMPDQYGLIAEEVHALGLTWLVDYDDAGEPFGVKYELLPIAMLLLWQDQEERLAALEPAA